MGIILGMDYLLMDFMLKKVRNTKVWMRIFIDVKKILILETLAFKSLMKKIKLYIKFNFTVTIC